MDADVKLLVAFTWFFRVIWCFQLNKTQSQQGPSRVILACRNLEKSPTAKCHPFVVRPFLLEFPFIRHSMLSSNVQPRTDWTSGVQQDNVGHERKLLVIPDESSSITNTVHRRYHPLYTPTIRSSPFSIDKQNDFSDSNTWAHSSKFFLIASTSRRL